MCSSGSTRSKLSFASCPARCTSCARSSPGPLRARRRGDRRSAPQPAVADRRGSRAGAAPSSAETRRETAIVAARILLSEGRPAEALDELERAIATAVAHGDDDGLRQLGAELQGIARYRPRVRDRALELADVARAALADVAPPARALPGSRAPAPAVAPADDRASWPGSRADACTRRSRTSRQRPRPAPPAAPPRPPRRGVTDLARDWDLLGPRGFAIVGGAVTALGIILLFVLAANRGWITPAMRVAIGALVSAAAVGVGFWVRPPLRPDADVARRGRRRNRRWLREPRGCSRPVRPRPGLARPSARRRDRGGRGGHRDRVVVGARWRRSACSGRRSRPACRRSTPG